MKLRIRIALLIALAAFVAVGAAASPAPADAASPCWKRLLDDWVDNARIDKAYPAPCYREAIKRLKGDLRDYSSAAEDIQRALSAAVSANNGQDPDEVEPPDDQRQAEPLPPIGSDPDDPTSSGESGSDDGGLFEALLPRATGAASVPLPLLILAGLAMLLLGAAGVSYAARRVQARRVGPGGPPQP